MYCSNNIKTGNVSKNASSCLTKPKLMKIVKIINNTYQNPKELSSIKSNQEFDVIWKKVNSFMKKQDKGLKEYEWFDFLKKKIIINNASAEKSLVSSSKEDRIALKEIEEEFILPKKPRHWDKNPISWLSNFDIENVMKRFDVDSKFKYKFLGVVSIDFALKNNKNQCMYSDICHLNVNELLKTQRPFAGLITNLDKHDEPGSHWTSTFINLDKSLPSYGAYYYDSVARPIPPLISMYLNDVKKQIEEITNVPFPISYNKTVHQKKNTECGMFSMIYQIRWIRKLKKNKQTKFNDVVNVKITDHDMVMMRDILFRPTS
jgi:hypothetical protein